MMERLDLKEATSSLTILNLEIPKLSLKPWSYYEEKFSRRDIFSFTDRPQSAQASQESSGAAAEAMPEFYRNLKLTGIIVDENPQAILHDPQTRESFFIHKGEGLKDAVLKEIEPEKVVFDYHGQLIELKQ